MLFFNYFPVSNSPRNGDLQQKMEYGMANAEFDPVKNPLANEADPNNISKNNLMFLTFYLFSTLVTKIHWLSFKYI